VGLVILSWSFPSHRLAFRIEETLASHESHGNSQRGRGQGWEIPTPSPLLFDVHFGQLGKFVSSTRPSSGRLRRLKGWTVRGTPLVTYERGEIEIGEMGRYPAHFFPLSPRVEPSSYTTPKKYSPAERPGDQFVFFAVILSTYLRKRLAKIPLFLSLPRDVRLDFWKFLFTRYADDKHVPPAHGPCQTDKAVA